MAQETVTRLEEPYVGTTNAPVEHPLASVLGSFADDPFWDEFVQLMEEERRKIDESFPIED